MNSARVFSFSQGFGHCPNPFLLILIVFLCILFIRRLYFKVFCAEVAHLISLGEKMQKIITLFLLLFAVVGCAKEEQTLYSLEKEAEGVEAPRLEYIEAKVQPLCSWELSRGGNPYLCLRGGDRVAKFFLNLEEEMKEGKRNPFFKAYCNSELVQINSVLKDRDWSEPSGENEAIASVLARQMQIFVVTCLELGEVLPLQASWSCMDHALALQKEVQEKGWPTSRYIGCDLTLKRLGIHMPSLALLERLE